MRNALASAKREERANASDPVKRPPVEQLARFIAEPLISSRRIRSADEYRTRTYNQSRQIMGLIDHLFVRYPVPLFLYRTMLTGGGMRAVFDTTKYDKAKANSTLPDWKYRDWFFAVAQGESFANVTRDVFTKREAHWFLQAPSGNEIPENILWARAAAAGAPLDACDYLVHRLDGTTQERIGARLPDVLRFYASEWHAMRGYDRDEITDFVREVVLDQSFSFKGRTFGSMRKLSHEWHRTVHSAHVNEYRSWIPAFPHWEHRTNSRVVRALELTNNRVLADEGRTQRHCVYTYTSRCIAGLSRIVSVRWFAVASRDETPREEVSRLTLEVTPSTRTVVQIRGRANRRATDDEMKAVRHWAGEQGLRISPLA